MREREVNEYGKRYGHHPIACTCRRCTKRGHIVQAEFPFPVSREHPNNCWR